MCMLLTWTHSLFMDSSAILLASLTLSRHTCLSTIAWGQGAGLLRDRRQQLLMPDLKFSKYKWLDTMVYNK